MSTEKNETAEAIIVVGPYLWKCVNCNLLMSRQHSIDDHLITNHRSPLRPVTSQNDRCKLAVCGCQNSQHVQKKHQNIKKRSKKHSLSNSDAVEKSILCLKSSNTSEDLELEVEDIPNAGENGHDPGGILLPLCELNATTNIGLTQDTQEVDVENDLSLGEDKQAEATEQCENSNSEFQTCLDKQSTKSKDNTNDGEVKISEVKEEMVRGTKREFEEEGEGQSRRKSRRSNKGKHSLYKEFEMGPS